MNKKFYAILVYATILVGIISSCRIRPLVYVPPTVEQVVPASSSNKMFSGRFVALAQSPANTNLIFAGSESGGMFKSIDGGRTWRWMRQFPCFTISDVEFHPSYPNMVFSTTLTDLKATNGGGLWYSLDTGNTWNHASIQGLTEGVDLYGFDISFLGDTLFVATNSGYIKGEILGDRQTFSLLAAGQLLRSTLPVNAENIFAFYETTIGKINSANTFVPITEGPGVGYIYNGNLLHNVFTLNPFDPHSVYAAGTFGRILKLSTEENRIDILATIEGIGVATRPPFVEAIVTSDSPDSKTFDLYYSNGRYLYFRSYRFQDGSTMAVTDWQRVNVCHEDPTDILFDNVSKKPKLIAGDGGILTSNDGGTSFMDCISPTTGLNALQVYSISGRYVLQPDSSRKKEIYWGTQDNGMWFGQSPFNNFYSFGVEGGFFNMNPYPSITRDLQFSYFDESGNNVILTSNVLTEGTPSFPFPATVEREFISPVPCLLPNGNFFSTFIENSQFKAYLYERYSRAWLPYSSLPMSDLVMRNIIKSSGTRRDPVVFFAEGVASGGVINYELKKLTGTIFYPLLVSIPGSGVMNQECIFAVNPQDPDHIFIADAVNNRIIFTTNGGRRWNADVQLTSLITRGNTKKFGKAISYRVGLNSPVYLNIRAIQFNPTNPNIIWVGTLESGVYVSVDAGTSWTYIEGTSDIPDIRSFFIDSENTAYLSSFGRGIFKITLAGVKVKQDAVYDYGPWIRLRNGEAIRLRDLKDPDICLMCDYVWTDDSYFTSVTVDANNNLVSATIHKGKIKVENPSGKNKSLNPDLIKISQTVNITNEWLKAQVKDGSVITAIILEGNELKGVITDSPKKWK